jgi:glycosyltransferase involved in cell wall biosynthesis
MMISDDINERRQDKAFAIARSASTSERGMAPRQSPAQRLDFDVVIATRNRPQALELSIPLILGQSRQPEKLIVVDSSDDHAAVSETVAKVTAGWTGTVIVEHTAPGSAFQRNRGLAHVEAAVVIFPDDDSLFHPGTCEAIMRAYELDTEGRIAGVCAADAPEPPPGVLADAKYEMTAAHRHRAWMTRCRRRLKLDFDWWRPLLHLGALRKARLEPLGWFEAENCVFVEYMAGYRMSFRTAVIRANPFDETLTHYAAGEDWDANLAATRHGALVGARNARVYHHRFPGGRGDPYTLTRKEVLNCTYVTLKHVYDAGLGPAEAKRVRWLVRLYYCRLMVLSRLPRLHRRSSREELRGVLAAGEGVKAMLNASRDELAQTYSESFARRGA